MLSKATKFMRERDDVQAFFRHAARRRLGPIPENFPDVASVTVEVDAPLPGGIVVGMEVRDLEGKLLPNADDYAKADLAEYLADYVISVGRQVVEPPAPHTGLDGRAYLSRILEYAPQTENGILVDVVPEFMDGRDAEALYQLAKDGLEKASEADEFRWALQVIVNEFFTTPMFMSVDARRIIEIADEALKDVPVASPGL